MEFKHDVIISHGFGCPDGAVSAWCFWRSLPSEYKKKLAAYEGFYSDGTGEFSWDDNWVNPCSVQGAIKLQDEGMPLVFVFAQPGTKFPSELIKDKRVVILDLDLGDELVNVAQQASSVMLLDHHDSSSATLEKHGDVLDKIPSFSHIVDTRKSQSGATLAWNFTHDEDIPPFVEVIRIEDTWSWNDKPELQAKFVTKALKANQELTTFEKIEQVYQDWDTKFQGWATQGSHIVDADNVNIKLMAKACDLGYIKTTDGKVYTVAYAQAPILVSEVGVAMRKYAEWRFKCPIDFCITWKYLSYKNLVLCSGRSPREGLNLGTVLRNIAGNNERGGGHPEAAAFNFDGIENLHKFIRKTKPRDEDDLLDILRCIDKELKSIDAIKTREPKKLTTMDKVQHFALVLGLAGMATLSVIAYYNIH